MHIDKKTPIPLYYQLAEGLQAMIESGKLHPGDRLPSERVLSQQFSISRMTVRQAINYLAQRGRVEARPGLGTFVAESKITHDALHLVSFTEEMLSVGHEASSTVLEQSVIKATELTAPQLMLTPGAQVVRVTRLRKAQGVPLVLETVQIPLALAPSLGEADLSNVSLYQFLEDRVKLQIDHAIQSIEGTVASKEEAKLMGIGAGAGMLLIEGVSYTTDRVPVEAFKALYRADRFRIELESRRLVNSAGASQPRVVMRADR